MLKGVWTAMATPFLENGELDVKGLKTNIAFQAKGGASGLLVNGSTGESLFLSAKEKEVVLKTAKEASPLPIMAGTGEASTQMTLEATQKAKDLGADCALVVTPYYVKPTQAGIIAHFERVAKAGLPLVVYNNPGRAAAKISAETLKTLSEIDNVIGVKDSCSEVNEASKILPFCGESFTYLSGEDTLTYPLCTMGAQGVVSVASNIVPNLVSELVKTTLQGNLDAAKSLHFKLFPLIQALFCESNPIPVKAAMTFLNLPAGHPRAPLMPLSENGKKMLFPILESLNLLEPVHG